MYRPHEYSPHIESSAYVNQIPAENPTENVSSPQMILNSVDLPDPLSPSKAIVSPSLMEKPTADRAATVPKDLLICLMSRINV